MSVARIHRLLHATGRGLATQRPLAAFGSAVLAATALGLGFAFAALSGLAVVAALLASLAAALAWRRARAVAQSYEAMALAVMGLTLRLAQVEAAAREGLTAAESGAAMFAAEGNTTGAAVDGTATVTTGDLSGQGTVPAVDGLPVIALPGPVPGEPASAEAVVPTEGDGDPDQVVVPDDTLDQPAPSWAEWSVPLDDSVLVGLGDLDVPALAIDADQGGATDSVAATPVPDGLPGFALTSLRGDTVTGADLRGRPAVVVLWRPGCDHSRRLTPELVAWESLQGPRLVVFAACDGPTAFRAGLPGMVILDPTFSVGQALGALGTPAALPIDAGGRPTGPLVTGASAVTTLLLDAMRDWASAEPEPVTGVDITVAGLGDGSDVDATAGGAMGQEDQRRPTVLLRRVEVLAGDDADEALDWDTEPATRRVG